MKHLALVTGLFALLAGSSVHAQSINLTATIPFDFQAGDKLMPAGDYKVQPSAGVVLIRQASGDKSVYLLTNPDHRNGEARTGSLEFKKYGQAYFLSKIWTAGIHDGRSLPMTSREKEMARSSGFVQTASVPISSR